jgi:hypothetical protein
MPSHRLLRAASFPPRPWVTAAHTNATPEKAYLFTSPDGLAWTPFGPSPAVSDTLRDPSLVFYGSAWRLAATHGGGLNATADFLLFSSPDLLSWSASSLISTAAVSPSATWAPHWFIDPADASAHILVALKVGGSFAIYELHPTNTAMTTWSAPVAVAGTGFATNTIDPCLVYNGGTYYLFWKDDGAGTICLSTSSAPFSGYAVAHTGDWAGWKAGAGGGSDEGPGLVHLLTGDWRIYFSQNSGLTANHIYHSETSDPTFATGWSAPAVVSSLDGYNHPLPIRQP